LVDFPVIQKEAFLRRGLCRG